MLWASEMALSCRQRNARRVLMAESSTRRTAKKRADTLNGRRDESRQVIVQRILDAAAKVFAHAGFNGATMTDIAQEADLPKPNVNYYFREKLVLYRRVLHDVQAIWSEPLELFQVDADPAETLASYIRAKVDLARRYPIKSRVFANEMIHGAPFIAHYLRTEYNRKIARVWETFDAWIADGLIDPIDPKHLMIQIWAATQTYADHEAQVTALLGSRTIADAEYEAATSQLAAMVIKGVGARKPGTKRSKRSSRHVTNAP